jgi:guanylate kinase
LDANHLSHKTFNGNLFVISAPSGTGKTSLVKALLKKMSNITMSTSHTTRPAREGEVDGKDYYFTKKDDFESMIKNGDFLEYANVFDNYYGTSQQSVNKHLEAGEDVILEIDWQGAQAVRALVHPISIFILPPSLDALKDRLTGRATDSEAVIAKRLASSVADIRHYKQFNYVVINDNFDKAVEELIAIVRATRLNLHNLKRTHADLLDALEA